MCGGLEYDVIDKNSGKAIRKKVFFPIPHAQIPVVTDSGIELMQWGRRKGEDETFPVPQTGWARLQSLSEGKWNRYQPTRVRIPALQWMEKDNAKTSHWFDMEPGSCLLGVRIHQQDRDFVYIVTRPAPPEFAHIHHRIPLIVARNPVATSPVH